MLEEALTRLRQTDPHWWIVLVIILRGHAALRQGDLARAAGLFAEGVTDAKGLHHTPALLGAMAGLAGVALVRGQAERAARLLGAIEAERESVGIEHIRSWLHAEKIAKNTDAALEAAAFEQAGPVAAWHHWRSHHRGARHCRGDRRRDHTLIILNLPQTVPLAKALETI